jgi:hypothetical protein
MSDGDGTTSSTQVLALKRAWMPVTASCHDMHEMPPLLEDLALLVLI